MKPVKHMLAAMVALTGMTGQLAAAPACATDTDMAAFRTAAVQQQLMVAGFMCKDMDQYNQFVVAYRSELQKSDSDLKSYFIHHGGEAGYDTFKTKMANLAALSDSTNAPAYCDNAAASFHAAFTGHLTLNNFVQAQQLMITMPQQAVCENKAKMASDAPRTKVAVLDDPQ
jgi:hypothetical protein